VAWSWTGILISYLLRNHPIAPMTLALWRDLATSSGLALVLLAFRRDALRVARRDAAFLSLYGASLTLMNVSWTLSVAWNGAAVSTVLVYSSPGITALAARFVFGERLNAIRVLAFAGSLIGCVFVARANDPAQWNLNAAGITAGLVSAVSFTAFSMMGKAASHRSIDPWTAMLAVFAFAAVALLPIASLTLPSSGASASLLSLGARWDGWLLLLLLVFPTLGGYGLYTVSLAYLPTGTANLIATLEPVLTTIWAYFLLGESLDAMQSLGGALIIGSVAALHLDRKARRASEARERTAERETTFDSRPAVE
jgi:drug/metabolite transporter (DMT)-like permease